MAAARQEREVLSELLELYRNLPTLWDIGSDLYKDRNQKSQAWELLAEKLREIEPDADVAITKKKIEHMRTAYKREEKKIKESKKTGSGANDVHVPNLWYFDLLSPLFNKDVDYRNGVETLTNDEEDSQSSVNEHNTTTNKKYYKSRDLEVTKRQLIETAQELLQRNEKKANSFGVYIGEQLEQLDTFQRQVAEKLISDVIFMARTGNLNYNSKIVSPPGANNLIPTTNNFIRSPSTSPQYPVKSPSPSPSLYHTRQSQHSTHFRSSAPRLVIASNKIRNSSCNSPNYIVPSPPNYIVPSPPSQYIRTSPSPNSIQYASQSAPSGEETQTEAIVHEAPVSVLRDFLIVKNNPAKKTKRKE